ALDQSAIEEMGHDLDHAAPPWDESRCLPAEPSTKRCVYPETIFQGRALSCRSQPMTFSAHRSLRGAYPCATIGPGCGSSPPSSPRSIIGDDQPGGRTMTERFVSLFDYLAGLALGGKAGAP